MILKKGDVVTIMANGGGEYVGKWVERRADGSIVLEDPRFVSFTEDGKMGFASGVAMTGVTKPKSMIFYTAAYVCETNPEVLEAYEQSTTSIIKPAGGGKLVGV